MKKRQTEKKLSLKKLQMTKINNLKVITGGNGGNNALGNGDGNDNTFTFPTMKTNDVI